MIEMIGHLKMKAGSDELVLLNVQLLFCSLVQVDVAQEGSITHSCTAQ